LPKLLRYSRLTLPHGFDAHVEVVADLLPDGDAQPSLELVGVVNLRGEDLTQGGDLVLCLVGAKVWVVKNSIYINNYS